MSESNSATCTLEQQFESTKTNVENEGAAKASTTVDWPRQVDLCGEPLSITDYQGATNAVLQAAQRREGGLVSCHAVHAVVTFGASSELRPAAAAFDMITPDGQPVRWGLNLLHGAGLKDRVYGPEFMLRVCQAAAEQEHSLYLYGGSPEVIEKLETNLTELYPQLKIAGAESPPFRALTEEEDQQVIDRINNSGADIVFIGLGCPKQDLFAYEHRATIKPVQICVGAAFDFHAGAKSKAPAWMQARGLEWLFRLGCEPRRLWKRYLVTNSHYVWLIGRELLHVGKVMRQRKATRVLNAKTNS